MEYTKWKWTGYLVLKNEIIINYDVDKVLAEAECKGE